MQFQRLLTLAVLSVAICGVRTAEAAVSYNVIPLGSDVFPECINNSGLVVGYCYSGGAQYTYIHSGTESEGSLWPGNVAYAINDAGRAVGSIEVNNKTVAFMCDAGQIRLLPTLGGTGSTVAYGINQAGRIVGYSSVAGSDLHAFFYNGAMHDLGTSGRESIAWAINKNDQIVGWYEYASDVPHAFLYDGTMHDLGSLGGGQSSASDINDNGQVVGIASIGGYTFHAFLYDGTMHDLGILGGTSGSSNAKGINLSGQVVGASNYGAGSSLSHAYIYDGTMRDLNGLIDPTSGWVLQDANDINDAGWIVGYGTLNGQGSAFLAIPTPEPSALLLLIAGAASLAVYSLSRRKPA
jgi:probable HAF family extracellular repeat protein